MENFGLERLREWTHQDRESVCDVCRKERERKSEKLRRERASDVYRGTTTKVFFSSQFCVCSACLSTLLVTHNNGGGGGRLKQKENISRFIRQKREYYFDI